VEVEEHLYFKLQGLHQRCRAPVSGKAPGDHLAHINRWPGYEKGLAMDKEQ